MPLWFAHRAISGCQCLSQSINVSTWHPHAPAAVRSAHTARERGSLRLCSFLCAAASKTLPWERCSSHALPRCRRSTCSPEGMLSCDDERRVRGRAEAWRAQAIATRRAKLRALGRRARTGGTYGPVASLMGHRTLCGSGNEVQRGCWPRLIEALRHGVASREGNIEAGR